MTDPTTVRLRTPRLLDQYRCPTCASSGVLEEAADSRLACRSCGQRYPVVDGVPLLFRAADLGAFVQHDRTVAKPDAAGAAARSGGAYHWREYDIESFLPPAEEHPRILLIGCGDGGERPYLEGLGYDVTAFDIRRSTGTDFLADAHNVPLDDGTVDVVLSMQVLEHLRRPWVAMAEMARVLRPGGWCVGSVAFLKAFHDSYFHMTHQALAVLMEDAGLTPDRFRGAQNLTYTLYGALFPIGSRPLRRKLFAPIDALIRGARVLVWSRTRKADPDEPSMRFHTSHPMSFRDFDRLRFAPAVVFRGRKPVS